MLFEIPVQVETVNRADTGGVLVERQRAPVRLVQLGPCPVTRAFTIDNEAVEIEYQRLDILFN